MPMNHNTNQEAINNDSFNEGQKYSHNSTTHLPFGVQCTHMYNVCVQNTVSTYIHVGLN